MKKIIALILALVFVVSLCGCNSNKKLEETIWALDFPLKDQTIAWAFNKDGKLDWIEATNSELNPISYLITYDNSMSYKLTKDSLTVTIDGVKEPIVYSYTLTDDTLSVTSGKVTMQFKKIDSLENHFIKNGRTLYIEGDQETVEEVKHAIWWW